MHMKSISPTVRIKFIRALTPHLLARQCFTAKLSDWSPAKIQNGKAVFENGKLVLNGPFPEYDDVTEHFMLPIRPAIESIRAFPLHFAYPKRRNATFERLVKQVGRGWNFDHLSDEAFDARCVFQGVSNTGFRLVYSFDSRKLDMAAWLKRLWDPQVLTNPATVLGKTAVHYAKKFSGQSHVLRFVPRNGYAYEDPHVLIYASRERIVELFILAAKRANFTRPLRRGLTLTYGRAPRA
jgi:hypothetical protein